MRGGVPELMGVNTADAGLGTPATKQLRYTRRRERTFCAEPKCRHLAIVVVAALLHVVSPRRCGLGAERNRPPPTSFADHGDCRSIKVEVGDANIGDFRQSGPRVDHDAKKRSISDVFELAALAGSEQGPEILVIHNGHRTVRYTRSLHIGHRRGGDESPVTKPFEEWLERAISNSRCSRPPAFQLVADEKLNMVLLEVAHCDGEAVRVQKVRQ